tara:strand:- start:921 stop:1898 length:978 start_codon:yes stop_codon:yes gene_type:complete
MIDMQREEWLQLLLNELPEQLFVLDQHGRFVEGFGGTFHSTRLDSNQSKASFLHDILSKTKAEELLQALTLVLETQTTSVIQYSISPIDCLHLSIDELEQLEDESWFEATIKPLCTLADKQYVLWQERDITHAHKHEQNLKRLSETDELTGILNRRAFTLQLNDAFTHALKTYQNVSCLMIDIDHFKEINDQVGHLSGDEVITHVADICQKQLRATDAIGRLGGEEFGVMLNNISAIQAYDIAERIRESIEKTPCHVDDKIIYPTVSIGISEVNTRLSDVKELLIQADKAMYYSKHTGRNQVTIYHTSLPEMKIEANNTKILIAS